MNLSQPLQTKYRVLGLMSGTSMDGLDCGIFSISIDKDYHFHWDCIDFKTIRYNEKVRSIIRASLGGDYLRGKITDLMLGQVFAVYVKQFLNNREIDLIGSHGQTIQHNDGKFSQQVGDPQYLYGEVEVPIVHDFRQGDIEAGGNGAPLMPFLDWLLFKELDENIITLNVGGISNITCIPKNGKRDDVIGFDTGPGMAMIDECTRIYFTRSCDEDGELSKNGNLVPDLLEELMLHPFISQQPPKSSGRHEFSGELVKSMRKKYSQISIEDFLRTLVSFTAKSISYNLDKYGNFDISNSKLIVSGGGVFHPVFMDDLRRYCHVKQIESSIEVGIDPNMKESLLMAALAVAKINNLHSNMRQVTGVTKWVSLGKIYKGN
ncbi:MAG: anhydro-N-acetylmuramic acid kinase [Candidatus Marinimicrobia bacterium]|nr:anhydro-N-acetylmuramic acid kinase [Candidatus Neomarinimicrobiota bacterium]